MADRVAEWTKPGPGTWEQDSSHCSAAPGPIQRELYETCLDEGMSKGFADFGAPLKTMEMRWVNGKFYRRLVPLVGGNSNLPAPPKPILWLASRLHPAFRRAERRAEESFEIRRWRDEIARWEREWKPQITARNTEFGATDPATLDDGALVAHLRALDEHLHYTTALHFRLHVSDMGPLGDLMVHLEDWGLSAADSFRALVAASPATRAPADTVRAIADAVRAAGVEVEKITSLDDIRNASTDAAAKLDAYLATNGWRLTSGYDLEDKCLIELPEVVIASVRNAPSRSGHDESAAEAALATLRDEVPAEHRAEFDEVAGDARLSYGLRDENGPITYEWPAGLMRRALLACGDRLAAKGALSDPGDVFELTVDEVVGLLEGRPTPSLAEIDRRADERRWWSTLDAPAQLGPDEPPPPIDVMPPNLGRLTRLVLTVVSSMEAEPEQPTLTGLGIGTETYRGRARVVHDAAEALMTVEPGDVLITPYTAPTYNAVLAVAGAVVTQEGGLLCHAAVIARELGLPAVIGATDAMGIPDGAQVEVDPTTGRVTVLTAA